MNNIVALRKSEHIRINLEEDVQSQLTTGLEDYHFIHQALPECNLNEINTQLQIFGKTLRLPLFISPMTGGTPEAEVINKLLAEVANEAGVGLGLGSQRAALEKKELAYTYQIRKYAPDILLFANLGAIQLNNSYTEIDCKRAVEMVDADALVLHLNPLQEALQPEGGEVNFKGLLKKIEVVCKKMTVPVIVKEVGCGISEATAMRLQNIGVAAIDVAGAGGTSWSQVEMHRIHDEQLARVASSFRGWGITTAESIKMTRKGAPETLLFASGGLRSGIDVAKCIVLGATLCGMASPFLKAVSISSQNIFDFIEEIRKELQICMFLIGANNLNQLQQTTNMINISKR